MILRASIDAGKSIRNVVRLRRSSGWTPTLRRFAQTAGYRLVTTDGAFRQFEGLDLVLLGEDSKA
jgi:hypothetical protein